MPLVLNIHVPSLSCLQRTRMFSFQLYECGILVPNSKFNVFATFYHRKMGIENHNVYIILYQMREFRGEDSLKRFERAKWRHNCHLNNGNQKATMKKWLGAAIFWGRWGVGGH